MTSKPGPLTIPLSTVSRGILLTYSHTCVQVFDAWLPTSTSAKLSLAQKRSAYCWQKYQIADRRRLRVCAKDRTLAPDVN